MRTANLNATEAFSCRWPSARFALWVWSDAEETVGEDVEMDVPVGERWFSCAAVGSGNIAVVEGVVEGAIVVYVVVTHEDLGGR